MKDKITVAIAGLGSRGYHSYATISKNFPDDIKIVAAAEPDPDHMKTFRENFNVDDTMCFDTCEELLKHEKLADMLFICTLDRMHFKQAIAALEKGYDLLLEKPISVNPAECKQIAETANRLGRKVVVCHVLRYTAFYTKLKQLISDGAIGDVISIQAMEQVCYWHQAHSFIRGNWANSDKTSSMILQKCCHDMDIYLWLAGKHCSAVSSFGELTYFNEKHAPAGSTKQCSESCSEYGTCVYNPFRYYSGVLKNGYTWPVDVVIPRNDPELLDKALKTGPYGRCVFHCDNNVVDHQVVNLLLEGGATINFTMCAFTSYPGRTMHIMGTKGDIVASMDDSSIILNVFDKKPEKIDCTSATDQFGHGGGDYGLLSTLIDYIRDGKLNPAITTIDRSVESHFVAMAAEESRVNGGKVISIEEYAAAL